MIILNKNKKAQTTYTEIGLIVFSIIVVALSLFISSNSFNNSIKNLNKEPPDLTYKFPSIFIHTFLYQKISKEDLKVLNLDENKVTYVKDLLYLDTDQSLSKVEEYRFKYIEDLSLKTGEKNLFKLFKTFSKDENINFEGNINLLKVRTIEDFSALEDLDLYLDANNYFFYIKSQRGRYITINFKGY